MKRYLLSIILFLSSLFCSIKPMDWASFKEMPAEIKLTIIAKLLEDPSIATIINSLKTLRLVDKEFYEIVSEESQFRPFFELSFVEGMSNIFDVFSFIKANPMLLQYPDLAHYLHSKFSYLPIDVIQDGLSLLEPEYLENFKKSFANIDQSLYLAVTLQNIKQIFPLLLAGANMDALSPLAGATSLFSAVRANNFAIVKLLLDKGTNPNVKIWLNHSGATPLANAIKNQNYAIAELLLKFNADPDEALEFNPYKAYRGSPLELAISSQDIALVELLIQYGANINIEFSSGFTPIMHAAFTKNTNLVRLLIEHGADIRKDLLENELALIQQNPYFDEATRKKWLEAYQLLLESIEEYISGQSL